MEMESDFDFRRNDWVLGDEANLPRQFKRVEDVDGARCYLGTASYARHLNFLSLKPDDGQLCLVA